MAETKIRADRHGLYVRTNGSVYRPQKSITSYPTRYSLQHGYDTAFKEGMEVTVQVIRATPFCRVVWMLKGEEWQSHGAYAQLINGKFRHISSEMCWSPG